MYKQNLPFPRGQCASDGGIVTMDANVWANLEGNTYVVPDTVHKLGGEVTLRVVRNSSGSAITAARKCVRWSTADGAFGRKAAGTVNAQGAKCKPLDDAYTVGFSIPSNDLFYVVEAGPCDITTTSSAAAAVALTVGTTVTPSATGVLDGTAATDDDYIVGAVDELATDSSQSVRVMVMAGLSAEN